MAAALAAYVMPDNRRPSVVVDIHEGFEAATSTLRLLHLEVMCDEPCRLGYVMIGTRRGRPRPPEADVHVQGVQHISHFRDIESEETFPGLDPRWDATLRFSPEQADWLRDHSDLARAYGVDLEFVVYDEHGNGSKGYVGLEPSSNSP